MSNISDTGVWNDETKEEFLARYVFFDRELAAALSKLFWKCGVVDLGCGSGKYVQSLRNRGIDCDGYDGNARIEEFTGGVCKAWDLTVPKTLPKKYDWVLSLEVAEHIPREHEATYIQNLHNNNTKGIVLSWADIGQNGDGHVNCRRGEYVRRVFEKLGYGADTKQTEILRLCASLGWFKKNIIVFRKK
jgi:2-polyprenyl-3-methyl-5-hydroxy-6-metoxy-1,4-benzoquinol methylase